MAAAVYKIGDLDLTVAAGYSIGPVSGFASPATQITKQPKSTQNGEAIQRLWKPNAVRSISLTVSADDKDTLLNRIQAIEQEAPIDSKEPIILQYTPQDSTNANFVEVYSMDVSWEPTSDTEHFNNALDVLITMETHPSWRQRLVYDPVNMLTYNQATAEDANTGDISAVNGGVTTVTRTGERSGSWSYAMAPPGAVDNEGFKSDVKHRALAEPGQDYVFSVYGREAGGSGAARIELNFMDVGNVEVQSTVATATWNATYARTEVTATAPSTAVFIDWAVVTDGTHATTLQVDDMQLETGTTASTWVSPVYSNSVLGNLLTPNQASAEVNTNAWTKIGGGTALSQSTQALHGSQSVHVPTTAANAGAKLTNAVNPASSSDAHSASINWRSTGVGTFTFQVSGHSDTAGSTGGSQIGAVTTNPRSSGTTGWLETQLTGFLFTAQKSLQLGWSVGSSTGPNSVKIDKVKLERGVTQTGWRLPGPLELQDAFSVSGDAPTEIAAWCEPSGDSLANCYLGIRNQSAIGAPTLADFSSFDGQSITASSSYADIDTSTQGSNSLEHIKGTYRVFAYVWTPVAASDYSLRWRIDTTQPQGYKFDGPEKTAASSTATQWLDLGDMVIPSGGVSGADNLTSIRYKLSIRAKKAASSGSIILERVVLLPTSNGVIYTSGEPDVTGATTLAISAIDGKSVGYTYAAGMFANVGVWPSSNNSQTTAQTAVFSPFIAGPGTVDFAVRAVEADTQLSQIRMKFAYYPRYFSPVS